MAAPESSDETSPPAQSCATQAAASSPSKIRHPARARLAELLGAAAVLVVKLDAEQPPTEEAAQSHMALTSLMLPSRWPF
ncbi:unnamed protein product [Lampetra planeri]